MRVAGTIRPFIIGMNERERLHLLALSHVEFLMPIEKLMLIAKLGRPSRLFTLSLADLSRLTGRRHASREWMPGHLLEKAAQTAEDLTRDLRARGRIGARPSPKRELSS